MTELKEYIVTAKSYAVVDELCNDIESPNGDLYIPNRKVEIADPRYISRNTHYYLTEQEAELLKLDHRVLDVRPVDISGIVIEPDYIQTSSLWTKNNTNSNTDLNWGLLRVYEGSSRSNWGSNGTNSVSGTIDIPFAGENVDVVIVDGLFDPNHPEYATNSDGTGGSRVIQYNWYQLNPQVDGSPAGNYFYGNYVGFNTETNNNHGAHVAGTVAGNTQGWARKSNIYNIYVYISNSMVIKIFDYIRVWHRSKPINPITGVRNPTVVNNSWGYRYATDYTNITSVFYRGVLYNGPFTTSQLNNFGIYVSGSTVRLNSQQVDVNADIVDSINDGIIIVGSAGNNYSKIDIPGGIDYDNYATAGGSSWYYNRYSTPGGSGNSICVGSIDSTVGDFKATYSNCGPRVDIYAPGTSIQSSFNSPNSYGGVSDSRNSSYYLGKISGTSMSGPQVAGMIACLLSVYPNLTQQQAIEYIYSYSKIGQISNTNGGPADYRDLQGSVNRFLTWIKERKDNGTVYPKLNYKARPNQGTVFPRTRILRYGS